MKILLAGGAGYIGSHTDVELLNAAHEIVVVADYSKRIFSRDFALRREWTESLVGQTIL